MKKFCLRMAALTLTYTTLLDARCHFISIHNGISYFKRNPYRLTWCSAVDINLTFDTAYRFRHPKPKFLSSAYASSPPSLQIYSLYQRKRLAWPAKHSPQWKQATPLQSTQFNNLASAATHWTRMPNLFTQCIPFRMDKCPKVYAWQATPIPS